MSPIDLKPSVRGASRTIVVSDVHLCGVRPAVELVALLDRVRGPESEVVFNGDVFDFDALTRDRTERGAVSLASSILDAHPEFVQAVRRMLFSGARVVFVPGNHDAQLAFLMVQRTIAARLGDVTFKPWFYMTASGYHIEHGHQYDPLCALDSLTMGSRAEDTIGTVVSFYVPLVHASDPIETSLGEILARFAPENTPAMLRDLCAVSTTNPTPVGPHEALFAPKLLAAGVIETKSWKRYSSEAHRRLRAAAGPIAGIHGSRGVIMGHTHHAYGETVNGVFYGNSGSWVPGGETKPGTYVLIEDGRAELRSL